NGNEKRGRRFVRHLAQIRTDFVADAIQLVAGGTALGENLFAARSISLHRSAELIVVEDLFAIRIDSAREQLSGTFANAGILVLQETLAAGGIEVCGLNWSFFQTGKQLTHGCVPAKQHLQNLRAKRGTKRTPV